MTSSSAKRRDTGPAPGRVVTFYSYKGGSGRTMAAANAAWILASNGRRVLLMDWDLESPGLHRYLHPFLFDKELRSTRGVFDLLRDYARSAMDVSLDSMGAGELLDGLDLTDYHTQVRWDFGGAGRIDLMPAGQQDDAYSRAVSTFSWTAFYERLGGAALLREVRERLGRAYDYVLIDSRAGFNDVAGICTQALPDVVVACFTMATQSIEGTAAAARAVQRRRADGVRILPVPMRVDYAEHERLEAGRDLARRKLTRFLTESVDADAYWGSMEIPYLPLYAYEEFLAPFAERPGAELSLLAATERLVGEITQGDVRALAAMPEALRVRWRTRFQRLRHPRTHDVAICYAAVNRTWAEWTSSVLERGGLFTRLYALDYGSGPAIVDQISRVVDTSSRTVLLVSRDLAASPAAARIWQTLIDRERDSDIRLLVVRVDGGKLPSPFNERIPVNLGSEQNGERAAQLLREALELSAWSPADDHGPRFPGTEPPVWQVRPRSVSFHGRSQALEDLRDRFSADTVVRRPQVLHGLGGVGKTQLAIEYANRFAADYDVVWWISADEPGSVKEGLGQLAHALRLPTANNLEENVQGALDHLRRGVPYSRWLIVLDNADDPQALQELIPRGPGHVLITSRNQEWITYAPAVEVDIFSRAESVALLRGEVSGLTAADADRVAEILGDLPLALVQAAAYLTLSAQSVDDYITLLRSHLAPMLDPEEPVANYPRTAAATWLLAMDHLREESPAAAAVLEMCSFFAPEPIPVALLSGSRFTEMIRHYDPLLRDLMLQNQLLRRIAQYALARLDLATNSIEMHRLVQAVLRDRLNERREEVRTRACELLAAADPGDPDTPDLWPQYAEIWPHARAIELADCSDDQARTLTYNLIRYRYREGDYERCLEFAAAALRVWPEDDELTLRVHMQVANVQRATADYAAARSTDEHVLAEFERKLGENHLYTLMAARSVAADMRIVGDYDRARKRDELTVRIFSETFGATHPQTLQSENNLAVSLRLSGDFREAATLDDHIYDSRLQQFGPRHPDTLVSGGQLGRALRDIGQLEQSKDLLATTLAVQQEVRPTDHWETLRTAAYLASTLRQLGEFAEAHELALDTLDRYRRTHLPTHLDRLACELITATTYSAIGADQRARDIASNVLDRYGAVLSPIHTFVLSALNNLGIFQRRDGDVRSAEQSTRRAYEGFKRSLGPQHPYTLIAALNLANDLYGLHNFRAALELDTHTYFALENVLGGDHPDILSAATNLALSSEGAPSEPIASAVREQAVAKLVARLGHRNPRTLSALTRERFDCYIEPPPT